MHFTTFNLLSSAALLLSSTSILTNASPTPSIPAAKLAPVAPAALDKRAPIAPTLNSALDKRTTYRVDSQSGDVAISDCGSTFSNIWGRCTDTGCNGVWENIQQVNLPCITVGVDPQCADQEPQFFCRRVSGGYNGGWADRNGMLDAYFKTNYCYNDFNFFFVGGLGTPEWTALRGDDGAWINVEFKIGINGC